MAGALASTARPRRGNVNVVMHVLLDYHWTVWAMHVQVMSMRIDRIANSATEDHANVKAAVWPVMMTMLSMLMHMVLVLVMVSYAMPRCMQEAACGVGLDGGAGGGAAPMRMASVVSQRWS